MRTTLPLLAFCSALLLVPVAAARSQSAPAAEALTVMLSLSVLEFNIDQPLAAATGRVVNVAYNYDNGVRALQVPGAVSLPTSVPRTVVTVAKVDIRQLLKGDEPKIVAQCKAAMDKSVSQTGAHIRYETTLPFALLDGAGQVLASTTTPYALDVSCGRAR